MSTFEIFTATGLKRRNGLLLTHELLGTPIEFGFRVDGATETDRPNFGTLEVSVRDHESSDEIAQSIADTTSEARLGYLTHVASGFGVVFVHVPAGESVAVCARIALDELPLEAKTALRDAELAMPGATVAERAQVLGAEMRAKWEAKQAQIGRREQILGELQALLSEQADPYDDVRHLDDRPEGVLSWEQALHESVHEAGKLTSRMPSGKRTSQRARVLNVAATALAWVESIDWRESETAHD